MGGYYSTFYTCCDTVHMAQYYDVQHGILLWINGRNHFQLEPVLPPDQNTPPLD